MAVPVRVRVPGGRHGGKSMRILEHTLEFDHNGWAPADHLTDEEINRCVRFHFQIEHGKPTPKPAADAAPPAEPAGAPETPVDPEAFPCPNCGRSFDTPRALRMHRVSCDRKQPETPATPTEAEA